MSSHFCKTYMSGADYLPESVPSVFAPKAIPVPIQDECVLFERVMLLRMAGRQGHLLVHIVILHIFS